MTQRPGYGAPSELSALIVPSLYVGAGTAFCGGTSAAAYATAKGLNAPLWTISVGYQTFVLGSSFWATRSILRQACEKRDFRGTKSDLLTSAGAGGFAGAAFGAVRGGRVLVGPSAILWSVIALGGQGLVSIATSSGLTSERTKPKEPILTRLSRKDWWPLKQLSDEEYEAELNDKIVALEAEIAVIDDKIIALKATGSTSNRDNQS